MGINLQKGQRVDLTKGNTGLKNLLVGLGWDPIETKKEGLLGGLLGGNKQPQIDCDASAIMLNSEKKLPSTQNLIYYGNLSHSSNSVIHQGDNLTGEGDGDDEQIIISLDLVPKDVSSIVFVVNIYKADTKGQDFGLIKNAYIRVVDGGNNNEILRYNLSEGYSGKTALVVGEIYRHENDWKFSAIGEATNDKSLKELVTKYK